MSAQGLKKGRLAGIVGNHEAEILANWVGEQTAVKGRRGASLNESELRAQCEAFLRAFRESLNGAASTDVESNEWRAVRGMLDELSRARAAKGFSSSEMAFFVMSLKRPLFGLLREIGGDAQSLADTTWEATEILDRMALFTTEVYQKAREEIIARQQEEMLELSTPVVTLWKGILALPMIGTLDSARTQTMMESLLQTILDTGSSIAIIDITGVPTVDTLTAQHLLKTVTAARLMGAECILSGIRPQIAQTIVHLGLDLGGMITKASLADAFAVALERTGRTIVRVRTGPGRESTATAIGMDPPA